VIRVAVGLGYEIGVVDVRTDGETYDDSPRKDNEVCEDLGQFEEPRVLVYLLPPPVIPTHPFLSLPF